MMCERSFLQIDEINKHIINHREVHHEHIGLYQAQQSNRRGNRTGQKKCLALCPR